jgi:hypothetical protein
LTGDVLVYRDPALLPTDVRKVTAVNKIELAELEDVVVFSAKGDRPLCGLLGGGSVPYSPLPHTHSLDRDYDGDTIRVLWHPDLVRPFANADLRYLLDPTTVSIAASAFVESQDTIGMVIDGANSEADRSDKLKAVFLDQLFCECSFGFISSCHTAFIYAFGGASEQAVLAAHLFGLAMDAPKQGKTLTKDMWDKLKSMSLCSPGLPCCAHVLAQSCSMKSGLRSGRWRHLQQRRRRSIAMSKPSQLTRTRRPRTETNGRRALNTLWVRFRSSRIASN